MRLLNFILIFSLSGAVVVKGQNRLAVPDTLTGAEINLNIKNSSKSFYTGYNTKTIGINGDILGPTLILNKGASVKITVSDSLTDTTTIHWHGLHIAPENDGGPHTVILPGGAWKPQFIVKDNAATYWYHPHLHAKTAEHVTKGAAGFIIVRDIEESLLNLPRRYGVDDFPIVVQSRAFDVNKQFITKSELDSVILVNGTINPFLQIPAQFIRFRLLNGSTERTYNFGFTGNIQFYQIAGDGGLLDKPVNLTRLRLAPGERAEVLIDFSKMKGQTTYLMSYASELPDGIIGAKNPGIMGGSLPDYTNNKLNGTNFNVLQLNIIATTNFPVLTIPSSLIVNKPWDITQSVGTRTFTLSSATGMMNISGPFYINGKSFNMETINFSTVLNNIEIWQVQNNTGIAHPFHVHGLQFFIIDRNGNPVQTGEQGRKDNVLVLPLETVRFILKFEDFANSTVPYMYHCHLLTHEDDGMMGQFTVNSPTSIYDKKTVSPEFRLNQNYPNPFNPVTNINYSLSIESNVKIVLVNTLGQIINTLVNKVESAGVHYVRFEAENLTSGVYFYMLTAKSIDGINEFHSVKKLLLIK